MVVKIGLPTTTEGRRSVGLAGWFARGQEAGYARSKHQHPSAREAPNCKLPQGGWRFFKSKDEHGWERETQTSKEPLVELDIGCDLDAAAQETGAVRPSGATDARGAEKWVV